MKALWSKCFHPGHHESHGDEKNGKGSRSSSRARTPPASRFQILDQQGPTAATIVEPGLPPEPQLEPSGPLEPLNGPAPSESRESKEQVSGEQAHASPRPTPSSPPPIATSPSGRGNNGNSPADESPQDAVAPLRLRVGSRATLPGRLAATPSGRLVISTYSSANDPSARGAPDQTAAAQDAWNQRTRDAALKAGAEGGPGAALAAREKLHDLQLRLQSLLSNMGVELQLAASPPFIGLLVARNLRIDVTSPEVARDADSVRAYCAEDKSVTFSVLESERSARTYPGPDGTPVLATRLDIEPVPIVFVVVWSHVRFEIGLRSKRSRLLAEAAVDVTDLAQGRNRVRMPLLLAATDVKEDNLFGPRPSPWTRAPESPDARSGVATVVGSVEVEIDYTWLRGTFDDGKRTFDRRTRIGIKPRKTREGLLIIRDAFIANHRVLSHDNIWPVEPEAEAEMPWTASEGLAAANELAFPGSSNAVAAQAIDRESPTSNHESDGAVGGQMSAGHALGAPVPAAIVSPASALASRSMPARRSSAGGEPSTLNDFQRWLEDAEEIARGSVASLETGGPSPTAAGGRAHRARPGPAPLPPDAAATRFFRDFEALKQECSDEQSPSACTSRMFELAILEALGLEPGSEAEATETPAARQLRRGAQALFVGMNERIGSLERLVDVLSGTVQDLEARLLASRAAGPAAATTRESSVTDRRSLVSSEQEAEGLGGGGNGSTEAARRATGFVEPSPTRPRPTWLPKGPSSLIKKRTQVRLSLPDREPPTPPEDESTRIEQARRKALVKPFLSGNFNYGMGRPAIKMSVLVMSFRAQDAEDVAQARAAKAAAAAAAGSVATTATSSSPQQPGGGGTMSEGLSNLGEWTVWGLYKTTAGGDLKHVEVPQRIRDRPGHYKVLSLLPADNSFAMGSLYMLRPGTKVIIMDIDGVLTTGDKHMVASFGLDLLSSRPLNLVDAYDPTLRPHAVTLCRLWAAKGYQLVYVSGRQGSWYTLSVAWMIKHGLPPGPIQLTRNSLPTLPLYVSVGNFKVAYIRALRDKGFEIVGAYGNTFTDVVAYEAGGVPKERTWIISGGGAESWVGKDAAGAKGTQKVIDWTRHIAEVVLPFPDVEDPELAVPYVDVMFGEAPTYEPLEAIRPAAAAAEGPGGGEMQPRAEVSVAPRETESEAAWAERLAQQSAESVSITTP